VEHDPERYSAWFRIYVMDHWVEIAALARTEQG
jgi:hypothetical protein